MAEMLAQSILDYAARRGGQHRAGTFGREPLKALERHWPIGGYTFETGCGASTILGSNLSKRHVSFTLDDRAEENSSVLFALQCPIYRPEAVEFIFGPTQRSLPRFTFSEPIDAALIDGPHGFPFPEIEYYFVYPHLKPGGILIIDDVHIPTIFHLYRFLREEPMFEFLEKYEYTAFFRRTDAATFDPFADGWWLQEFNKRRFPMKGRDERVSEYIPAWLTKLIPAAVKASVKERLLRMG